MSDDLDNAKALVESGKLRAAVEQLYYASAAARRVDNFAEGSEILRLANVIRERADRRLQADCDEVAGSMHEFLYRQSPADLSPADLGLVNSIVTLLGCRVIGGAGLAVEVGADRSWALCFTDDRVALLPEQMPRPEEVHDLGWEGLHIEVEGAGVITKGTRIMGGGFGIVGAATGMLAASAINTLTARTGIDTVIHLQTPAVELYLYYGSEVPAALRRTLSPVFLRLRQAEGRSAAAMPAPAEDHVVDRLHKLANLLDRGLIEPEEFARLKADLMGRIPD